MLEINLNNYHLNNSDYLIIGCSAGPDSMALLHYLKNNTPNPIVCCHINHNKRTESKEEEKYLKEYCQKEKIIFETMKIEKYTENNFENEARNKRYTFYEQTLDKYNAKYLFLAHHGDDLIETILMKIERGSNLEGYAGIKEYSTKNNYIIIRPFINYTKQELITYNHLHNIHYFIDRSNESQDFKRNRYRKNILPFLKKENNNIHQKFLKYSKTLLEYHYYIEEEIITIYPKIVKNNSLNLIEFSKLHPFLQKNLLHKFLILNYHNQPNIITEQHTQNILNLIQNQKPNLNLKLPQNYTITKSYNTLSLIKNKQESQNNYKILLKDYNEFENCTIQKITETAQDGNDICRLNSQNINLPLYLRNKKNGDFIYQKGLNGKKKIKEIFIENKIPKNLRDKYPILVDSLDQVIWIPNLKKSKFNSQKNDFCDIILKYCEKEEKDEQ